MDVRCDRCQTEYELDEMRLTTAGVAVRCTNCGNVFKVRRNLGEEIVPAKQKVREWHVRRQDGTTLTLRELTDLQKAVVERKVSPEDSVSLSGESWHQLGSMPELASFFEVVEAANQAQAARTPTLPRPSPQSARPATGAIGRSPTWENGPQSFGPAAAVPEPAWSAKPLDDPELTELLEKEDLQAVKRGRTGVLIGLLLLLLVAGAAGAYFYLPHGSAPGTIAMAPPRPPDVNAPVITPVPEAKPPEPVAVAAPAPVPAAAPAAPPTAGAPAAPVPAPAAAPAVAAAVPAAPSADKAPPKAPAKASDDDAPSGKSFDYFISQGHKLLDSKPTQALVLFQKAADLDPRSPEPDSGRGLAYANMDKLKDAAAAFEIALRKSPEFTEAIMGLAEISREQGNAKKAIGLYQKYLDLTPDGADAPAARAQLEQLRSASPAPAPAPATRAVAATPVAPAEPAPAPPPPAPQPAPAPVDSAPPVVIPDQPAQ